MLTPAADNSDEAVATGRSPARVPVRREIPGVDGVRSSADGAATGAAPVTATEEDGWPDAGALARALLAGLAETEASGSTPSRRERVCNLADELQVVLDRAIGAQLTLVMTHPRFQRLEAAWRGLVHVVRAQDEYDNGSCEVWVADYGPADLRADLGYPSLPGDERMALTQSWLFKALYEAAWDQRGGRLFGLLVTGMEFGGDAECSHPDAGAFWPDAAEAHAWTSVAEPHAGPPDETGGLALLRQVADVAELSFCPFVGAASPLLLGRRDFAYLPDDPAINAPERVARAWEALRKARESRFVGLVVPRVVLRPPLAELCRCGDWFGWPSAAGGVQTAAVGLARRPLLGSGAYGLAAVVIRSMSVTNWPSDIQGVEGCGLDDGLVEAAGLLVLRGDDLRREGARGACVRAPVELTLTGQQERRLGELGFLAVSRVSHTARAAFYAQRMVREPSYGQGRGPNATQEMHSLLPYILTAARFAQMVRAYAQKNHGQFRSPEALQHELENWVNGEYVGERRVLRRAVVRVTRLDAGKLQIDLEISPRLSADDVEVAGVIPLSTTVLDERVAGLPGAAAGAAADLPSGAEEPDGGPGVG